MRTTGFTNDMTGMYVMHDALRRELRLLGAVAARTDADPREVLRSAPGWELFKAILHAHHGAEDDALWPGLRDLIGDKPEVLAVLDAMDAEHADIETSLRPLPDPVRTAYAEQWKPVFEALPRWGAPAS